MTRPILALASVGFAAFGASSALAGTYIVDDDGGVGVDFTNISAAIAATGPGDVLLVRAGTYSPFVLDKPQRLIGDGIAVVSVQGTARIESLPQGSFAALTGMRVGSVAIEDCAGVLVLDEVWMWSSSFVEQCTDVRIMHARSYGQGGQVDDASYGQPAFTIEHARVELVESEVFGGAGEDAGQNEQEGGWGGHGIELLAGASLHVSSSTVIGGEGGAIVGWDIAGWGGDGGDGVVLSGTALEPASALITGRLPDELFGGSGGFGSYYDGSDGYAITVHGPSDHVRLSGITSGVWFASPWLETPVPPDPSLEFVGVPVAGQPMTFRVSGPQGASVELLLGRTPQIVSTGGTNEDLLLVPLRTKPLGVIDSSGIVSVLIPLPAGTPPGQKYFAQARLVYPDQTTRYTNSTPLIVR